MVLDRKRVAIMQPYFFPYAGYYRLFAAVDLFIVFDCVQFPRRGRVHRSKVPGPTGEQEWLTLPLTRQPRDVLIHELSFASDARVRLNGRLARLPWFGSARGAEAERMRAHLAGDLGRVIDYLQDTLELCLSILGLQVPITRSSTLGLDSCLKGQDRVIAAAAAVGATVYVNPPGGRVLYRREDFHSAGIELRFLSAYRGRFNYMLPALMSQPPEIIRDDICTSTELEY
jgi:hypothetical protein